MRRAAAALGWVALTLAIGCERPRTELVVRVDSEVPWGAGQMVQSVVLSVRRGGATGPLRSARTTPLGDGGERRSLPLLVGVVAADDDADTPVWIEALGCGSPNGCTASDAVVAQRAVVRFARGQTQEITLLLASACLNVSCPGDQRCAVATGMCEPATRAQEMVRPFDGDATVTDAGTDAVVDGPALDDRPAATEVATTDATPSFEVTTDLATADLPPADVAVDVPLAIDVPVVRDVPVTPMDMGFPPTDVGFPPTDVGFPQTDMGFPPVDTGPTMGTRGVFDSCATNADCLSGECLQLTSGARFCTRRCAATSDCADGFVCNLPPSGTAARCVPDDIGTPCTVSTSAPCVRFCVGNPVSGMQAHCTRECRSGADCPAGYGCQDSGIGTRVCVSTEQPCSRGIDCVTNICVGMTSGFQGCTSRCTSDSDCSRRMTRNVEGTGVVALPPYRCQTVGGERLCVPPLQSTGGDLVGSVALGGSCGSATSPMCRSGVCDAETNVCVQGCTPTGGCPSGFVCRPWVDRTDIYLVCRRSATGATLIGGSCSIGADCTTGLCQGSSAGSPGYCTRFCNDRLCPTGTTCRALGSALDGTTISLCQPL